MGKVTKCLGCGKTEFIPILDLGKSPWCNDFQPKGSPVNKYPLNMVKCVACELAQLDYIVPREDMFRDHVYLTGSSPGLVEHFKDYAKQAMYDIIFRYGIDQPYTFVDIGGNDGTHLSNYRYSTVDLFNIESAKIPADECRTLHPYINVIEDFASYRCFVDNFKAHSVDVIFSSGSLFHLENLSDVLQGVKQALSLTGKFMIQCMYLGSMIDKGTFDGIYHEHLCYYSIQSLDNILKLHGLRICEVEVSGIHSGSLMVVAEHDEVGRPRNKTVDTLIKYEKDYLLNKKSFEAFAYNVDETIVELEWYLDEYPRLGETIYALGAPAKGTTLLNALNPSLLKKISYAVELNLHKIGNCIPGTNIEIIPEMHVGQEHGPPIPDYYLVLSHNFTEILIRRGPKPKRGWIIPFGGDCELSDLMKGVWTENLSVRYIGVKK